MERFSKGQLERASEIIGNISVAWFSAGVISPLFIRIGSFLNIIITLAVSLTLAVMFFSVSIYIAKEVK